MKIIVGLGNPEKKYDGTRHNIGFAVLDRIADKYNISMDIKKHKGLCGKGSIEGEKVVLVKPLTYMNLSGECVRAVADFYKAGPQDILVIFDDISLEPGKIRIRAKGSAGGHNGIKSIIAHLGSEQFARIKCGIGEKPKGYDLADYVLGHFSKDELEIIDSGIQRAQEACACILTQGIDAAMNKFN
ncbi:MAG: aminoacyl-tRNA hydrolase [Lachnospiraceae bacterium]